MTELKTAFLLAYKKEAAFGNAFAALGAGDTAYLFGDRIDSSQIGLGMEQNPLYLLDSLDWDALTPKKNKIEVSTNFLLMNGIPFYWALGITADGDDAGVKTHAITGALPATVRPSAVIHYEADDVDATSNLDKDVVGCRVDSFSLKANRYEPVKIAMKWKGLDIFDGVHLTNAPALPATAVDSAFMFSQGTFTWNSDDKTQVLTFGLDIQNNLEPIHVDRATTYYRPKYLKPHNRIITWSMTLLLKNKVLIDEIKAATARTFTIPFVRTAGGDDQITITLASSVAQAAPLMVPSFGEKAVYVLTGIAKTCSVAVRDTIASYEI